MNATMTTNAVKVMRRFRQVMEVASPREGYYDIPELPSAAGWINGAALAELVSRFESAEVIDTLTGWGCWTHVVRATIDGYPHTFFVC
jgi:hypothetical protein